MIDETVVVGGRYVLGEPLGSGGMAVVHRAVDERLDRPVAVKRMSVALAADRVARARFGREAHASARLNHPAIAAVFDTGSDVDPQTGVDVPFLVMELVEGRTLRAVLRDGPALGPERALEVMIEVLAALAHSHAAGIVHRDVKPANVMVTDGGAVKVMDFGIARAADESTTSLTKPAAVIGTAQYLSPEQARGEHVDARSDLYSAGCLLYELLLRRPVFSGESSVSLAYQHVNEDPVPPHEHDPSLSPELDAVVLKALAKDPADRYQSATEMSAALVRLRRRGLLRARGDPRAVAEEVTATRVRNAAPPPPVPPTVVAPPVVVPPPTAPPEPPRRTRRAVLAVLVALVVIAAAILLVPRLFTSAPPAAAAEVSVPDVLRKSRAEADTVLRNAGLVPQFSNVAGPDDATVDTVIRQAPTGGAGLPAGSPVTVVVNVGPDSARIPTGLVGRDVDDATRTLKDAGFAEVKPRTAGSQPAGAKEGEVLGVQPNEGQLASLSDPVVLVVAGPVVRTSSTTRAPSPRPTPSRTPVSPSPTPTPTESATRTPSASTSQTPSEEPSASETPTASTKSSQTPNAARLP